MLLPPSAVALALAVAIAWGVNFVVMKHAVSEFPPLLLTALRFGLAAIPMVFLVKRPACHWRYVVGFGALFGIIKFTLLFVAFAKGLPAGLAAIALQVQVFFTIAFAALLLGERPSAVQQISLVIAIVGVAAIVAGATGQGGSIALPVFLTLAAAAAWGLANIVVKRVPHVDMLSFMVWASLVPPLPMLAASFVVEGPEAISAALANATALGWAAILYLAYPVSVVSLAVWGWLLARYSAASIAPFALLVPVIGYAASAIVYGERLTAPMWLGAVLLLASLAINALAGRMPSRQSAGN